jgi:ferritin-like metal-binding protein YciE
MAELSARDSKLVQYLNEAYGTEKRLETSLQEHITMAVRPAYRKRLKEHLSETKRHAREVKQAISRLGGVAETVSAPGPQQVTDVAQAVVGGAQKAIALVQGPLHMLRGTGGEEKQLKNAKTEYASEAEEIATYAAIETLAAELGDTDVRQLARAIRREEERMRAFLEKEIARLTKAVVKAEVPASERRERSPSKRAASAGRKRSAAKRSTARRATGAKAKVASAKARPGSANSRTSEKARTSAAKARTGAAKARASAKAGTSGTKARTSAKTSAAKARMGAAKARTSAKTSAAKARTGAAKARASAKAGTGGAKASGRKPALRASRAPKRNASGGARKTALAGLR